MLLGSCVHIRTS